MRFYSREADFWASFDYIRYFWVVFRKSVLRRNCKSCIFKNINEKLFDFAIQMEQILKN